MRIRHAGASTASGSMPISSRCMRAAATMSASRSPRVESRTSLDGVPRRSPRSRTISGCGSRSSRAAVAGRNALCSAITDARWPTTIRGCAPATSACASGAAASRSGMYGTTSDHPSTTDVSSSSSNAPHQSPASKPSRSSLRRYTLITGSRSMSAVSCPVSAGPSRVTRSAERVAMRGILLASMPAQAGSLGYPRCCDLALPLHARPCSVRMRCDVAAHRLLSGDPNCRLPARARLPRRLRR